MKHPEQAALILRVRETTGLSMDALAEKVGVRTDTLEKYAAGGQPAGKHLLREIARLASLSWEGVPATGLPSTMSRANEEEPPTYGKPVPVPAPGAEIPPSAPHRRLAYILGHGTLEEIRLVRSTIENMWSQINARNDPPQIVRRRSGHQLMPLLGAIPAGMPQEAIEQTDELVSVPRALAAKSDYALRVRGESMTGKGLNDGDIILMSLNREAVNGAVVAALYDEDEVTLKTYIIKNGEVYLRSENPDYPPKIVPTRELRVQGVMVGKLAA